jgi:outer membrane murein-binding lipoprotein Lpp
MALTENTPVPEETAKTAALPDDKYASDLPPESHDGIMYTISIVVALVVFVATGYFYWQNSIIDAKIEEVRAKTAEYQSKIDTLKKDPNVRAGELFASQKDAISRSITRSNAANYIREMGTIEKEYGFFFNGFSFSKDKVTT